MSEQPLCIALVLATPGTIWGGMEKHTLELADALAGRGHDVHVLTDSSYQTHFSAPIDFHELPVHLSRRNPWLQRALRQTLKAIQPTIVHAQGNKAAQLISRLPNHFRCTVGTVHGTKKRHNAYQNLDGAIAVSDDIADSLPHANVRCIYNGTGLKPSAANTSHTKYSQPLTVAVGRLEPVKGFDRLLRAWAIARPVGTLAILGEGRERARLEQLRHSLGLDQSVILPGYQSDISDWLREAHCCVISSDREGFPYIMIEALLADCPVLATPVSGIREFLPAGCIASSANVEDLAQLLAERHGSDLKQQQSLNFVRAKAELSIEAMTTQTLDFYQSIVKQTYFPTVDLSTHQPFASGYNRHCYRHPDDPEICLKVIRPDHQAARFRRQRWYKKILGAKRLNDNRQEQRAYQQAAITQGTARVWDHLPRFRGCMNTSEGLANASELFSAPDGRPARTLETELKIKGLTQPVTDAIHRFNQWLTETGILSRNLLPHNFVIVEHNNQPELYLIDGLGAPLMASLLSHIPAWRRRYIRRRIQRFWLRVEWELGDRGESWEKAERIR